MGYKFNATDEKEVITAVQKIESQVGPIAILISVDGCNEYIDTVGQEAGINIETYADLCSALRNRIE